MPAVGRAIDQLDERLARVLVSGAALATGVPGMSGWTQFSLEGQIYAKPEERPARRISRRRRATSTCSVPASGPSLAGG
jgi:hypothetical protein